MNIRIKDEKSEEPTVELYLDRQGSDVHLRGSNNGGTSYYLMTVTSDGEVLLANSALRSVGLKNAHVV